MQQRAIETIIEKYRQMMKDKPDEYPSNEMQLTFIFKTIEDKEICLNQYFKLEFIEDTVLITEKYVDLVEDTSTEFIFATVLSDIILIEEA